MAGHSKWKQIKHKKAATDAKRGQLFSKLVKEIMVAARSGNPSPDTNIRLRTAIERARAQGLPKDNIERAIERASGEGEVAHLQEFMYEATVPGGVTILIEGITDNRNRSLAEIKHLLAAEGGKLADPGSVLWGYEKIGTLEISEGKNPLPKETMELGFIEAGANDFSFFDGAWTLETDFSARDAVRQNLEKLGISVEESGHDYKARSSLEIKEEEQKKLSLLLEALSDHDDVQGVYTNIANT